MAGAPALQIRSEAGPVVTGLRAETLLSGCASVDSADRFAQALWRLPIGVARVVVVSSSELDRGVLSEVVSAEDELYVVWSAVEQSRLQSRTNDEGSARSDAREVCDE